MSCGTTFENNPLPPEVICPDPELCDEIIEAGCVAYSGAPVQCVGAQEGVLLSTIFNTIISRVLNCCPCVVCEDITYDISHITASQFRINLSSPSPMISHTFYADIGVGVDEDNIVGGWHSLGLNIPYDDFPVTVTDYMVDTVETSIEPDTSYTIRIYDEMLECSFTYLYVTTLIQ